MFLLIFKSLMLIMPLLISMAYLTLFESKILGYSQMSKGPNVVGMIGMIQPLADGMKLFIKEMNIPSHASLMIYLFSPILCLAMSILVWSLFPFTLNSMMTESNESIILMLAISSINIYCMLMSGWGSNSKYSFLGSLSAAAQMMSYEISFGLLLMNILLFSNSLNMLNLIQNQIIGTMFILPLLPISLLYLMSVMAETNSAPFDLTEGESELVSGFNIEYPGMIFALFFLAEYSHIMFNSCLFSILFLGAWKFFSYSSMSLYIKSLMLIFFFIWISTSFPSFSYDQLMNLMWKSYLPLSMTFLSFFSSLILLMNF